MMSNCQYNVIKIICELSKLVWFIEKHAIKDAKADSDEKNLLIFQKICKEAEEHIDELRKQL